MQKAVKGAVSVALAVAYAAGCTWPVMAHANVFHLAANIIALWLMYVAGWVWIPAVALGALGVWMGHAVGFSGALFAAIGLQWDIYDCKRNRISIAVVMALSAIIPNMSFIGHAVPFFIGMAISRCRSFIKQYHGDTN